MALGVVLLAALAAGGVDDHTVALWLCDEPQYLNMTLTDASPHQYDLRLMDAGGMRVDGRHGGCVARREGAVGQAVCYAEVRDAYPNGPPEAAKNRPAVPPAALLRALAEGDWTWELWLRANGRPTLPACLMDAGPWDLYLGLTDHGLEVVAGGQNVDAVAPLDLGRLLDGRWHHLAVTWSRPARTVRTFVDGQPGAPLAVPVSAPRPERRQLLPGLAGQVFGNADLTRPSSTEITPLPAFDLGGGRGTGWSERWQGWLRAPAEAEVSFRAEADWGVRLVVAGRTVIDGWGPDQARSGTARLHAGQAVPVVVEYSHRGGDARLRLWWSWPGHAEELVPAAAWGHEPAEGDRFDLALLSDQNGDAPLDACLDELRVSDVVRYRGVCGPPETFSRLGHRPAEPTGPALLFAGGVAPEVVDLGSRKHVFLDDVLLEQSEGVSVRQCPPTKVEPLPVDFGLGDATVLEDFGQVRLYYGGWTDSYRLATSLDGLHFSKPDLGIASWGDDATGMTGNAIFRLPGQASFFVDGDPGAAPDERFKALAFVMSRGIYALTSPDGIHWRRNETIALPFDCGGGAEAFWDEQRGGYACHLRHEGWYARYRDNQRLAARGVTRRFLRPWPFVPDADPVPRGAFMLPALWHELPTPFVPDDSGQVYRTRATKYPWAPDAYLAFVWRYDIARETRQTELATSRDGEQWRFWGVAPAYLPVGLSFGDGLSAKAALAAFGLVRREDEIWQYAEVNTTGHGPGQQAVLRATQRLDGFTCLADDGGSGWAVTRPLRFEGDRLLLNVAVEGELRVALLDRDGREVPGFGLADCEPVRGDSVRHSVRWSGGSLARWQSRIVRLRLELRRAKVYALQFVSTVDG